MARLSCLLALLLLGAHLGCSSTPDGPSACAHDYEGPHAHLFTIIGADSAHVEVIPDQDLGVLAIAQEARPEGCEFEIVFGRRGGRVESTRLLLLGVENGAPVVNLRPYADAGRPLQVAWRDTAWFQVAP